jgi:hypothetical protein
MLVANLGTTLAEFARIGAALSLFGVPIAVSAVCRRRRSRIDDVDLAVGQHLGGQVGFTSQRAAMTGHREHCPRASAGATSAAGASAAAEPLTIDLDSTICETYGLAKEDRSHQGGRATILTEEAGRLDHPAQQGCVRVPCDHR